MDKEQVAKRVQELRVNRGLSQTELARAAGVPVGTLRGLESGRQVPRLDTAEALARALGVALTALLEPPQSSPPPQVRKGGRPRTKAP